MTERDSRLRFEVPLYTITEAARIVDVPVSTLTNWRRAMSADFRTVPRSSGIQLSPTLSQKVRVDRRFPSSGSPRPLFWLRYAAVASSVTSTIPIRSLGSPFSHEALTEYVLDASICQ